MQRLLQLKVMSSDLSNFILKLLVLYELLFILRLTFLDLLLEDPHLVLEVIDDALLIFGLLLQNLSLVLEHLHFFSDLVSFFHQVLNLNGQIISLLLSEGELLTLVLN